MKEDTAMSFLRNLQNGQLEIKQSLISFSFDMNIQLGLLKEKLSEQLPFDCDS